jgi:hypothetical protein
MEDNRKEKGFLYNIRPLVSDNFYIFFVILSFLSFRFSFPGVVRSVMWVLLVLVNLPLLFKKKGCIDQLIYVYVFLGLFSILGWFQREYPFEFFLTILFDSYVPIVFYFIGRESSERVPSFYRRSLYAFLFVNLAGFVFLYTMPAWYVERSLEVLNQLGYYTEDTLKYARFASFLDSYHTSNFSVYLLCISIGGYYFMHDKLKDRLVYMFSFIIAVIGILLAQQRVAMFVGLALIPFGMFLMSKYSSKNKRATAHLSILILFGLFIIVALAIRFADYFSIEDVLQRFSGDSRDVMVKSRSGTWLNAIMQQENYIWGHGLGGGGHLAQSIGITPTVRDGSYFVILLETGFFSLLVFLLILISSVLRGYKRVKNNFIDFVILFFCCFSLIGANIIYYPYIIGFMWYAIGRINRKSQKVVYYE